MASLAHGATDNVADDELSASVGGVMTADEFSDWLHHLSLVPQAVIAAALNATDEAAPLIRELVKELGKRDVHDLDLVAVVLRHVNATEWHSYEDAVIARSRQLSLWEDDPSALPEPTEPPMLALRTDAESPYWELLGTERTPAGGLVAAPVVPEALRGTEGAAAVMEQWRAATGGANELGRLVALSVAVMQLYDLNNLARLAVERGCITPQWEYVYSLGHDGADGWEPEAFDGNLGVLLDVLRDTTELITADMAAEAMDHQRPGTWQTVSEAVGRIDDDYRAAVNHACSDDPSLLQVLGTGAATVNRYEALRQAAVAPGAERLREAILAQRHSAAEPDSLEIVRYTADHKDTLLGQGPRPLMEALLEAVADDVDVVDKTRPNKWGNLTLRVMVPKPARELIRGLSLEDRTVAGLESYLETWGQVIRDVSKRTPGSGPIVVSAEMIVTTRANTEDTKIRARDYQSRIRDAHDVIDALSYVNVEASFPISPKGGTGHIKKRLISWDEVRSVSDDRGNVTKDAWTVPRKLPDFLGNKALSKLGAGALPKGAAYKPIESDMYHFLMDCADRFYRLSGKGRKVLTVTASEVLNMGSVPPPSSDGDSAYKLRKYKTERIPEAFNRVVGDVRRALAKRGDPPVSFTLDTEPYGRGGKASAHRRKVIGLTITAA